MTNLKAIVTLIVSTAGALVVALGTGNSGNLGDLGLKHWLGAILAVLGSAGMVWYAENGPWHPYIKTVIAFLSAGIASLITALDDGVISQTEWLVAFIAAVTATGLVFQVQNEGQLPHARSGV